jgi:hypothetical protein
MSGFEEIGWIHSSTSPVTEEHRRFNAYDGIAPSVFIIEFVTGIPVHIVVQLARFCHTLNMEVGRWNKG